MPRRKGRRWHVGTDCEAVGGVAIDGQCGRAPGVGNGLCGRGGRVLDRGLYIVGLVVENDLLMDLHRMTRLYSILGWIAWCWVDGPWRPRLCIYISQKLYKVSLRTSEKNGSTLTTDSAEAADLRRGILPPSMHPSLLLPPFTSLSTTTLQAGEQVPPSPSSTTGTASNAAHGNRRPVPSFRTARPHNPA